MKHLHILTTLLLLTLAAVPTAAESINEKYNEQRPVVVICDWDRPPYEYIDDSGQLAGSNIDIITTIMDELGIPVRFVMKDWGVALSTFANGGADLILADARRFRDGDYAISQNIVNYNRICAAMYKDSVPCLSVAQLDRKGTVLRTGEYSSNYFSQDSTKRSLVEHQTPKVALLGLINGQYKYFIWGEKQLEWKIKELNLDGITLNDVDMPISEVHFVGHDPQLVDLIDDQYSRIKQRGDLAELKDKWLHPGTTIHRKLPAALSIMLAALVIAALLYLISRVVRSHVKSATRRSNVLNEMMIKALHMGNFNVMVYDIAHNLITNAYGSILPDKGMTLEEFTERIHPVERLMFIIKSHKLITGRERRFDLDKRWNQGTESNPHWLNFQGHAILEVDEHGQPAYVVNAIHDVTHEEEEQKAARELNFKYEVLSNVPLVALSFYDSEGSLIELNDAMKSLCGISDRTPQAKRFWEALNLFDVTNFGGIYLPGRRESILYCHRLYYPNLHIDKYVESYIYPLVNDSGEIANYLVGSLNLTSERNRNKACYQLEHEYEDLQDNISELRRQLHFVLCTTKRLFLRSQLDNQTVSLFRLPGERTYRHSLAQLLDFVDENDRDTLRQLLVGGHATSVSNAVIHTRFMLHGETPLVYRVSTTSVVDNQGVVVGYEGIAVDISELSHMKTRLDETSRLADDSVQMKTAFMASMAHELRTPLNGIVGFTDILEALGDTPDRAEYVHIIRNSTDMLQRIINDIIEASSLTDGVFAIEPKEVDFSREFDDICLTLEQRVEHSSVAFVKDNPCQTLPLTVYIGRIEQILTNFVTNAVKFTSEGYIKVGYRYTAPELYLYCEDTGIGIPKDKQKKVFERFVKLDEYVQGTGMGLAICRGIARSCGGDVGVISKGAGKGSTFWCKMQCG